MDVRNQNQFYKEYISRLQTEFILIDHGLCPDWSRETHKRKRDSIYLILDGQGKITINGQEIYPKKNCMVLLPKNSMVSLYSENETCYNKYWCDFIMQIGDASLFDVIPFPYMIELNDISHAKELLDRLDRLHLSTDAASALLIKSTLIELVALFLENSTNNVWYRSINDPFNEKVETFIYKHISEHIAVKRLADEMGFNEKYFIDLFKRHFRTTPALYIKNIRLERAKHELLYSDKKLTYIVDEIGYSNIQMLSKDFKAYTGFSPSAFRKQFK